MDLRKAAILAILAISATLVMADAWKPNRNCQDENCPNACNGSKSRRGHWQHMGSLYCAAHDDYIAGFFLANYGTVITDDNRAVCNSWRRFSAQVRNRTVFQNLVNRLEIETRGISIPTPRPDWRNCIAESAGGSHQG